MIHLVVDFSCFLGSNEVEFPTIGLNGGMTQFNLQGASMPVIKVSNLKTIERNVTPQTSQSRKPQTAAVSSLQLLQTDSIDVEVSIARLSALL